jgi:soluble lytic murein transglycosylase-like protein
MRLTQASWTLGIAGATLLLGLAILSVNEFYPPRNEPQAQRVRAPVPRPTQSAKPRTAKAIPPPVSAFAEEQHMTPRQLLRRWDETVANASRRFSVPEPWIRAVMVAESGGRTMSGENRPIVSSAGAMGLMQLMPDTYDDMRVAYGLGPNPQDPRDNIYAGTAFLHRLFLAYGFPAMFSAYNDGPGNLEYRLLHGELLPRETRDYVADITRALLTGGHGYGMKVKFTRPDGSLVTIETGSVVSVRSALPGEYAPGVETVITFGRMRQGVRENLGIVRAKLRGR